MVKVVISGYEVEIKARDVSCRNEKKCSMKSTLAVLNSLAVAFIEQEEYRKSKGFFNTGAERNWMNLHEAREREAAKLSAN